MRGLAAAIVVTFIAVLAPRTPAFAQDARQRQAAAEAYDRGTAAYLRGDHGEAAQWFETANRMAPAAPALMQAIRSHQRAENTPRAATLALRLSQEYADDQAANEYATAVLDELAAQLVRVDVSCDQKCEIDLDGKLQEFPAFFLAAGGDHTLVANFETGSKTETLQGEAGQTLTVEFIAPPPAATPPDGSEVAVSTDGRKPLPPLVTFIGVGVTGALLIGTILSGVDANSGVDKYEDAANAASECVSDCSVLNSRAKALLDEGQSREARTNILLGATAVVGVATGVIAIFLTDWSGGDDESAEDTEGARVHVAPVFGGAMGVIEGRF